ncbi:putative reverse transcriptase domain-containing protein [Tanacetum coccineum]|uniref:Reverse transcriptase domain-containing protein n=1 Tax=Tanacetum coccineum TaxID=301880 RepID=A0ABQ5GE31_9ASTR
MIHGSVVASKPKTMQEAIEIATELMDKKIRTFVKRQTENKRKQDDNHQQPQQQQQQQQQNKRQRTLARAYTTGSCAPNATNANDLPLAHGCRVPRMPTLDNQPKGTRLVRNLLAINVEPRDTSRGIIGWQEASNRGNETRLNIISCTKTQKYMLKKMSGRFLACLLQRRGLKQSEKKADLRIRTDRVEDFNEVFPEDLPGLFHQIDKWIFQLNLIRCSLTIGELRTRYGHYEFQVMPFGLTNAPRGNYGSPERVLCKAIFDKFGIVFIDDILIYSKNKKEHEEHLKAIMELLKKEELYAKFFKCEFWFPKASPKTPTEIGHFGLDVVTKIHSNGFSKDFRDRQAIDQAYSG